ncbi:cupin domain-containing protein [Phycisphaerales bacterium AB-hyl4]|uniref:Cupin domain-containing protein n=1 Tax=Natronomicrosphaera hydrolytica TaxID=3242702 RepID=A0ABV4U2N9_9BACT
MSRLILTSVLAGGLLLTGCQANAPMTPTTLGPDHHILHLADDIAWQDGPASLEDGAEFAVLEGDPSQPGLFTMRLRLPDGFHIAPHTHPGYERVTVLSGTFLLGHGSEADRDAANVMEAGSYTTMPPGMEHYAYTEGETVIQLTSMGPWEIDYLDPADDPRRR